MYHDAYRSPQTSGAYYRGGGHTEERQPESLLSPGVDPHGSNGHFASPYGAAAPYSSNGGGGLGRQRSSGGGGGGGGGGVMYQSSPAQASFREPSYGGGAGFPPHLAAGGSPQYYQQQHQQQQQQHQQQYHQQHHQQHQGGYMQGPPSPGYPYQAGPMAPPSPSRGFVRPRHGAVEQPFTRGLTSRKTRQQQQQQQQQPLMPQGGGGEEMGLDGGMDGLAPYSLQHGFSSFSNSAAAAAAGYGAAAAAGGGAFYDDGPPPTDSLMDLDEHDANRNSRLSSQQQQLATVRDPDHDASRWGAMAGQAAWASWVLVFGFPREFREAVINQFALFGTLQETVAEGNWLLLKYATRAQAEKAVAQNGTLLHTGSPQSTSTSSRRSSSSSSSSSSSGLLMAVQRVTPDVVRRLGVAMSPQGGVEVVPRPDRVGASLLSPPQKYQPQGAALLRQRRGSLGGRGGGRGVMSPEGFAINDSDLLKAPVIERPWWYLLWVAICSLFGWR